jgi:ATP-dependent Clp protease ATP-binding subunit ClpC
MYERFTNRACVVMQLAAEEARRFNHPYVDTEHILLGLVKEGVRTRRRPGVAAKVLRRLGLLNLRKMRVEVEKVVHSELETASKDELTLTSRAKGVIEHAVGEAGHLNLPDIGTGFLLLGLLHERDGVAGQVLRNLELDLDDMYQTILRLLALRADKSIDRHGEAPVDQ